MTKVKNERNTENLVRDALRSLGYYDQERTTVVAEQKTNVEAARKALPAQPVDATPSHRNDFSKGGVYGARKTG
jgi:hypothetical protein